MADLLSFWPFLFGWPAVALSVLAASFGLGRGHPRLLLVAATLVGPTSAHLALTPRFFVSGFVWGLFPVGVYLAAAVATRRNHMVLGAALVAANTAFFGWLAGLAGSLADWLEHRDIGQRGAVSVKRMSACRAARRSPTTGSTSRRTSSSAATSRCPAERCSA